MVIAAAGKAAALPGVVSAYTSLPVLGVQLEDGLPGGVDALEPSKNKVINYRFHNVRCLGYIALDTLHTDTSNVLNKISLDRINYQLR